VDQKRGRVSLELFLKRDRGSRNSGSEAKKGIGHKLTEVLPGLKQKEDW